MARNLDPIKTAIMVRLQQHGLPERDEFPLVDNNGENAKAEVTAVDGLVIRMKVRTNRGTHYYTVKLTEHW